MFIAHVLKRRGAAICSKGKSMAIPQLLKKEEDVIYLARREDGNLPSTNHLNGRRMAILLKRGMMQGHLLSDLREDG